MMTWSSAARTAVCTRATGVRPSSCALSVVIISSAAAPSLICEELPAWTPGEEHDVGDVGRLDVGMGIAWNTMKADSTSARVGCSRSGRLTIAVAERLDDRSVVLGGAMFETDPRRPLGDDAPTASFEAAATAPRLRLIRRGLSDDQSPSCLGYPAQ